MEGTVFDLDGRAASSPRAFAAGRLQRGRTGDGSVGPWGLWILGTGVLLAGLISAEVAVNQAIGGAATATQRAVLTCSTFAAAILIPVGVAVRGHLRRLEPSSTRASAAPGAWLVGAAALAELMRAAIFAGRLADHVGLDRDEPLTTVTISLQLSIALAFAAGFVILAAADRSLGRAG